MKLEITIDVDTSLDSGQIFISEDGATGSYYSVKENQNIKEAVLASVKNYLTFETKL